MRLSAEFPAGKIARFGALSAAAFVLIYSVAAVAGLVDFSPGLLRQVAAKWGSDAPERLLGWRAIQLDYSRNRQKLPPSAMVPMDELQGFNMLWNKVPYYSDLEHWGVEDYWATPVETMSSNGGDCEDYSIAKYFSLRELGIPAQNLRITYVRSLKLNTPHMVLAYYPAPDADPYILDNLTGELTPASARADLVPIYSFNDEDLWGAGASTFKGKSSQIRLWRELLDKMETERRI